MMNLRARKGARPGRSGVTTPATRHRELLSTMAGSRPYLHQSEGSTVVT